MNELNDDERNQNEKTSNPYLHTLLWDFVSESTVFSSLKDMSNLRKKENGRGRKKGRKKPQ